MFLREGNYGVTLDTREMYEASYEEEKRERKTEKEREKREQRKLVAHRWSKLMSVSMACVYVCVLDRHIFSRAREDRR